MEQDLLGPQCREHQIWVDWTQEIVSFHKVDGFDSLFFVSLESWQANIRILLTLGFRFQ